MSVNQKYTKKNNKEICNSDFGILCYRCLRREFQKKNFGLQHDVPELFVQLQFGGENKDMYFIIWSGISSFVSLSLVFTSMLLHSYYDRSRKMMMYLTVWSLLLLPLTCLINLANSLYVRKRRSDIINGTCKMMPWFLKVGWVTHNVAHVSAFFVSVMFWQMVYKGDNVFTKSRIYTFLYHGCNIIFAMINLVVSRIPTRLLHFYQPIIFCFIYTSINAVYYEITSVTVYSLLDWTTLKKTSILFLYSIIVLICLHVIIYVIASLRDYLFSLCGSDYNEVHPLSVTGESSHLW